MSMPEAVRGTPFRNPHFTLLWFAMLAFELGNLLMLQFPGFLTSLGASEGYVGLMYSASGIVALAVRPWLGKVIDLRSRRTVLLTAGAANGLLLLLLAIPGSLSPLLWVVFVGWRVAQIAVFAMMLTAASDVLRPERRAQGLALFGLSALLAITVGGLIGDAIRSSLGFSRLFVVVSVLAAISVGVASRIPAAAFGAAHRTPRRSFWYALAQRDLLPLWWASLVFAVGLQAIFTFLRTYVDERGVGSLGTYFLVYGGVAALLRIAASGFLDRVDPRRLAVVTIAAYGVGIGLLAFAGDEVTLLMSAAVAGASHGLLFPILSSQVVHRARDSERGSALAAFTAVFDLGLITMAPIIGRVIDVRGYTTGFGSVSLFVIAGAAVYAAWDRRHAPLPVVAPR